MKFKNAEIWKRSSALCVSVYKRLRICGDNGFKYQITRACLSVPSNIAEGLERRSDKDTVRFLDIAKSSCGEFYTQVHIGIEIDLIDSEVGQVWMQEAMEISAMIGGLIKHLTSKNT